MEARKLKRMAAAIKAATGKYFALANQTLAFFIAIAVDVMVINQMIKLLITGAAACIHG